MNRGYERLDFGRSVFEMIFEILWAKGGKWAEFAHNYPLYPISREKNHEA